MTEGFVIDQLSAEDQELNLVKLDRVKYVKTVPWRRFRVWRVDEFASVDRRLSSACFPFQSSFACFCANQPVLCLSLDEMACHCTSCFLPCV